MLLLNTKMQQVNIDFTNPRKDLLTILSFIHFFVLHNLVFVLILKDLKIKRYPQSVRAFQLT